MKGQYEVAQLKIACEELKKQVSGTDVNENKRKRNVIDYRSLHNGDIELQ